MKRILGLDLGTASIGWALVNESKDDNKKSSIVKLGVRVNPLSTDEKTDFEKGRPLSTNAERTQKRGARRNLQRYKQRRENLIEILKENKFISQNTLLTEIGKNTTHQTLALRARAAIDRIELEDLAKVLLAINKKRGYKSSRKANNDEEGQAVDGMKVAKELYDRELTAGQYVLELLQNDRKYIPDFYRSDLKDEFDLIWKTQKQHYPGILTDKLYQELQGKNKSATWAVCEKPFDISGIKRTGTKKEKQIQEYQWRVDGLTEKLDLEHLAIALQEINNKIYKSSGYLGAISDRSKELYFNKETVGQNLYKQLVSNPHTSLKNQVFYRQDYLDEFEKIWETQAEFHPELTTKLKEEIRDIVIFYQRKLKSQKSLISFCQFESWEQEFVDKETGKTKRREIGRKVIPKSSPLFQEVKIWQNLNNLVLTNKEKNEKIEIAKIDDDLRKELFEELNVRGNLKPNDILKILKPEFKIGKLTDWLSNYDTIEGNRTNQALFDIFQRISDIEGYGHNWSKLTAAQIKEELQATFPEIGIDAAILDFDYDKENWSQQPSYEFWHLLYSAEEDDKITEEDKIMYGNSSISLKKKLHLKYGFKPEYATMLANVSLSQDYGNLSAKAIRKIMPYLEAGHDYSEACHQAGYNHSKSMTAEELKNRELKPKLELLKKNSLRNPVVEKILNQMVNVVNQIVDEYGKPDEIRIELARELKKSAKERAEMTKGINDATKRNDQIRKLIRQKFNIPNPTKSDVVRYRLWQELEHRGHKDLFDDKYIAPEKIFSKEIDIEHIVPKALRFDDSFSNKTLSFKETNIKKANRTALDFITQDRKSQVDAYTSRVEDLYKSSAISRAKRNKLLTPLSKIDDGFIERDLRNSQYIAKKARHMLLEVFREVTPTTGSITDKLREDWDLVNVMKELNLPKYRELGLTEFEERLDKGTGELKKYEVIKDWSKRNDHRHHAMDALAVAFTTHNHIQYINNLNARRDTTKNNHPRIKNIETQITYVSKNGKRKFKKPVVRFRESAKNHIESILISFKNKNKVVTRNVNITKAKNRKLNKKLQLTPRGQLHKETIYGKSKRIAGKPVKLNKRITKEDIAAIVNFNERKAVMDHVEKYKGSISKAFDSKTLKNDPIIVKDQPLTEVKVYEEIFTIRKDVNPDNFKTQKHLDKVVDDAVRQALQERLKVHGGDFKTAFSDLEADPIYLNKKRGIEIKRVTITGVSNAEPLHTAKDHLGNEILDDTGNAIPADYVSTGNNHHVAIYQSDDGELDDEVVSFYDAVIRKSQNEPIIRQHNEKGWPLLFSLKQNEMFVFPSEEFSPNGIDLLNEKELLIISKHLFRVQKFSKLSYGNSHVREYVFRHHLETELNNTKALKEVTWKNIKSLGYFENVVKVRLNHIGRIVQIGEY